VEQQFIAFVQSALLRPVNDALMND